jgi:hypothetical protein
MSGWVRQLALSAQVRAGWSGAIAIWAVIAVLAAGLAALFLLIAAFFWLSRAYGVTIAGLALGIFFLVVAVVAGFACAMVRRRNIGRARVELEMRKSAATDSLLDPKLLAIGYQIGNAIGWRRLASLIAVGLLAAGVAREWTGHRQGAADNGEIDAES